MHAQLLLLRTGDNALPEDANRLLPANGAIRKLLAAANYMKAEIGLIQHIDVVGPSQKVIDAFAHLGTKRDFNQQQFKEKLSAAVSGIERLADTTEPHAPFGGCRYLWIGRAYQNFGKALLTVSPNVDSEEVNTIIREEFHKKASELFGKAVEAYAHLGEMHHKSHFACTGDWESQRQTAEVLAACARGAISTPKVCDSVLAALDARQQAFEHLPTEWLVSRIIPAKKSRRYVPKPSFHDSIAPVKVKVIAPKLPKALGKYRKAAEALSATAYRGNNQALKDFQTYVHSESVYLALYPEFQKYLVKLKPFATNALQPKALKKSLIAAAEAHQRIEKELEDLAEHETLKLCGAYRQGWLYHIFADYLREIPVPSILSREEQAKYRQAIDKVVFPLQSKAKRIFKTMAELQGPKPNPYSELCVEQARIHLQQYADEALPHRKQR
jgi:hypothetical protein